MKQLLSIDYQSLIDDYTLIQELQSNQGKLVYYHKNCFLLTIIQESFSLVPLLIFKKLA